jgi:hypothetical protein
MSSAKRATVCFDSKVQRAAEDRTISGAVARSSLFLIHVIEG